VADEKAVWWGRLNSHFSDHRDDVRVRWKDPKGDVRREEPAVDLAKPVLASELPIRETRDVQPGTWSVEVLLEDDVVDRKSFRIVP